MHRFLSQELVKKNYNMALKMVGSINTERCGGYRRDFQRSRHGVHICRLCVLALHSLTVIRRLIPRQRSVHFQDTLHFKITRFSKPILVIGTRSKAIKKCSVVYECIAAPEISLIGCPTGQRRALLSQAAKYFEMTLDINLDAMRQRHSFAEIVS